LHAEKWIINEIKMLFITKKLQNFID